MKNPNVTVTSMALPKEWVTKLKSLARKASAQEDRDVSYSEMIRRALKETYGFKKSKESK
jgi:hypothetical protein